MDLVHDYNYREKGLGMVNTYNREMLFSRFEASAIGCYSERQIDWTFDPVSHSSLEQCRISSFIWMPDFFGILRIFTRNNKKKAQQQHAVERESNKHPSKKVWKRTSKCAKEMNKKKRRKKKKKKKEMLSVIPVALWSRKWAKSSRHCSRRITKLGRLSRSRGGIVRCHHAPKWMDARTEQISKLILQPKDSWSLGRRWLLRQVLAPIAFTSQLKTTQNLQNNNAKDVVTDRWLIVMFVVIRINNHWFIIEYYFWTIVALTQ